MAPYPGGSEIYVGDMVTESVKRGHQVAVFAGEHQGDYNGAHVTSDANILLNNWDLIIVHGGDVNVQNFVLSNATRIPSPILYLLVLPSDSSTCVTALRECAILGCSTIQDFDHCKKYSVSEKTVRIRHGVTYNNCIGKPGFKNKYGITGRMFLSCGGYWPNKAMKELANLFEMACPTNSVLITTGYDNRMDLMPHKRGNVIPLLLDDREDVLSAIKEADCYLMHSWTEGFGLVLLESMLNKTPWISRNIAGATLMKGWGNVYSSDAELITMLRMFDTLPFDLEGAYNYATTNHLIKNTVDDIEDAVKKLLVDKS
jgi:glycosyltransferase involved in cell wall biosynthesis